MEQFMQQVNQVTETLLNTHWEYPFGPDPEVCMVGEKMFALVGVLEGKPQVTVKCDPDEVAALHQIEHIGPGYHMNKRHWITIFSGIDPDLLCELITESYWLVGSKIPKSRRPALGIVGEE